MLPIKKDSTNNESIMSDAAKQISKTIAKMQEAIDKKDMRAFYQFRDEVESLFRLYGYAEQGSIQIRTF